MGKSSPSPPPPVDQAALIDKQAEVNRISEFTPLGTNLQGTVKNGQFKLGTGGAATQVQLTPENQALFDLAQQTAGVLGERGLLQAEGLPGGPIDLSGLPEFQSELDFSSLPGLLGFDPSQFTGIPGSIDASGFTDLPQGFDFSGLTALPGIDDFSEDRARVEQATFQRATGLLNPEFLRQQNRLEQNLANRGLPAGGEAFDDEFGRFEDSRNRALQSAAFQAVQAGGTEQSRLFGLASSARAQQLGEMVQDAAQRFGVRSVEYQEALAAFNQAIQARGVEFGEAQFGSNLGFQTRQQALAEELQGLNLNNVARAQGIDEQSLLRSSQFNELASLLGLSQVQLPQFNAPQPIDVIGPAALAQNSALVQQQIAAQQQSDFMSGLFGLGSTAITAGALL